MGNVLQECQTCDSQEINPENWGGMIWRNVSRRNNYEGSIPLTTPMTLDIVFVDDGVEKIVYSAATDRSVLIHLLNLSETELNVAINESDGHYRLVIPENFETLGLSGITSILEENFNFLLKISVSADKKLSLVEHPIGPAHVEISTVSPNTQGVASELFSALGVAPTVRLAVDDVTSKSLGVATWLQVVRRTHSFNPGTGDEASVPLVFNADASMLDGTARLLLRVLRGDFPDLASLRTHMEEAAYGENVSSLVIPRAIARAQAALVGAQKDQQARLNTVQQSRQAAQAAFEDSVRLASASLSDSLLVREREALAGESEKLLSLALGGLSAPTGEDFARHLSSVGGMLAILAAQQGDLEELQAEHQREARLLTSIQQGQVINQVVHQIVVETKYGKAAAWVPCNFITKTLEKELEIELKKLPKKTPVDSNGFKIDRAFPSDARTQPQLVTDVQRLGERVNQTKTRLDSLNKCVKVDLVQALQRAVAALTSAWLAASDEEAEVLRSAEESASRITQEIRRLEALPANRFNPLTFDAQSHTGLIIDVLPLLVLDSQLVSQILTLFGSMTILESSSLSDHEQGRCEQGIDHLLTPLSDDVALASLVALLQIHATDSQIAAFLVDLPIRTPIIKPLPFMRAFCPLVEKFLISSGNAPDLVRLGLNLDLVMPLGLADQYSEDFALKLFSTSALPIVTEDEVGVCLSRWNSERVVRMLTSAQKSLQPSLFDLSSLSTELPLAKPVTSAATGASTDEESASEITAEPTSWVLTVEDNLFGWTVETLAQWSPLALRFNNQVFKRTVDLARLAILRAALAAKNPQGSSVTIDSLLQQFNAPQTIKVVELPVELRHMMAFNPPRAKKD